MATMLTDNEKELKLDKEYFDEFRDIELRKDFIHTSGNMGKIGTQSLEEIRDQKTAEMKIPRVWEKAAQVNQLKQDLLKNQHLCVTSDKLGKTLNHLGVEVKNLG